MTFTQKFFLIVTASLSLIVAQEGSDSEMLQSMKGSAGSVSINGEIYNQIALRPELRFGKLGLGFDIYLQLDSEGNVSEGSWDFSDGEAAFRTIADKIEYLTWGRKSDPFYLRAGSLEGSTLAGGALVSNYSNRMEYPDVRKLGLDAKFSTSQFELRTIVSDFSRKPGLGAFRAGYKFNDKLQVGFTYAVDIDQFAGLKDADGDGYPDAYDDLPYDAEYFDAVDRDSLYWHDIYFDIPDADTTKFENWYANHPDRNSYTPNDDEDGINGYGIDITYDLSKNVKLYSEFAQLIGETGSDSEGLGFGFIPLGLRATWNALQFKTEYRINSKHFVYGYWDQAYDLERVSYTKDENTTIVRTKESTLYKYGAGKGLYAQLDYTFFDVLKFGMGYQWMRGDVWNEELSEFENNSNNSFMSDLTLITSAIPKVEYARAYYQQKNIPNPFDFEPSESSIYGYDLAFNLSDGVTLIYKGRTTHYLDESGEITPLQSFTIETQININ